MTFEHIGGGGARVIAHASSVDPAPSIFIKSSPFWLALQNDAYPNHLYQRREDVHS